MSEIDREFYTRITFNHTRSKAMGRRKVAKVRSVAAGLGWLSPDAPLPDDATLAVRFDCREGLPVSCVSTLEPWRGQIAQWHAQGIQATTIHAALARNHFWVWSTERSGRSASRSPCRRGANRPTGIAGSTWPSRRRRLAPGARCGSGRSRCSPGP